MTHAIHKRRLLAVLTAVFALFALLLMHPTAGAVDEEDELIGANIQDGVLLGYYGPGGDIVLPNTVTKIGDEALKGNKKITGITIPGIGDIQSIEDFIVSNNLLPLGSLFYVLFCVTKGGWGWDNFLAEADTGKGIRFPRWSKLWLKFGIPALILVIFVMGYVPKITVWLGMA